MSHSPTIRPDFNFDVLYMPKNRPKLTQRTRTISIDSTSSGTDMEAPQSPTPIETAPHRRRSISEMLAFAYPIQQKTQTIGTKTDVSTYIGNDNQPINNNRLKDLMMRQQKILTDSEGFSLKAFSDRK